MQQAESIWLAALVYIVPFLPFICGYLVAFARRLGKLGISSSAGGFCWHWNQLLQNRKMRRNLNNYRIVDLGN